MNLISLKKSCFICLWILVQPLIAQELETTIFITGNTGVSKDLYVLGQLAEEAKKFKNPYVLLAGNAVPKNGLDTKAGQTFMGTTFLQIANFGDRAFLIPGVNEWTSSGRNGLSDLEKWIENRSKAKFYPGNDDPITSKDLDAHAVLIVIDSQWYLEQWDKMGYINEDSDVKNRAQFFSEFEHLLKKNEDKIKLVALHHPIMTHTRQGIFEKTAGFSVQDFQSLQYRKFRTRLWTLARQSENVIFLSGKDKNLQYLNENGIVHINSGAANGIQSVVKAKGEEFVLEDNGYARLDIEANGRVNVTFYRISGNASIPVHSQTIMGGDAHMQVFGFKSKDNFPAKIAASVYTPDEVHKSGFYKAIWGNHYRSLYGTKVMVPTVSLDTLKGGLKPLKHGGGQQSKSLRLEDGSGREYVMRALRKNTTKFIQANAFKDTYIGNALEGSLIDETLRDFYTTANPFTPFAVGKLSDAAGIYHTNPVLYYMPKQASLGAYNTTFGDELYMFEEHVGNTQAGVESFGSPEKILSTDEVLDEIVKNGKSVVDEPSYIRARLFDMLIGDWDRHEDQWRWALFKDENGTAYCKPIPRDRDQAFPKYDGTLVSFLTRLVPGLRKMQSYDEELRSPKWFATSPYHLDVALINRSGWKDWEHQAAYLQNHLTDGAIDRAFQELPKEVQGPVEDIKQKLKGRRDNLPKMAKQYYDYFNRFEVLLGTEKDDHFAIVRDLDGETTVSIQRKGQELLHRTFRKSETKEIWIYGLDGQDTFKVTGRGQRPIKIKVLGGMKHDTYDFGNIRNIKLYDYASKPNTIVNGRSRKWLVDDYDIHQYNPKKVKHDQNQLLPILGYDPDDGLRIGAVDHYTYFGIPVNPFTQRHSWSASYYTATSGYDLTYEGEFAHFFHNWNLVVGAHFASPNFSNNFFGFGNETTYDKDVVSLDFNRVRIGGRRASISLKYRGINGGSFTMGPVVEQFEVENSFGRFIGSFPNQSTFFERQTYGGVQFAYNFENKDNPVFPTLGMAFGIEASYRSNIGGLSPKNQFVHLAPHLALDHRLNEGGTLVLATTLAGDLILADRFEFYHAAHIGGNNGLRGFRNERFTGKYSFYQNTDLRTVLGSLRTSIIPLQYGLSVSYDFGRVWVKNDTSNVWHQSFGGSFWIEGLGAFTTNMGFYSSSDGGRAVLTFGFAF